MSRIEELIAEHCPSGVPYKELQELFDTRNGYTPSKSDAANWTGGTVPWFRMEDIRDNGQVLDDSIQHIASSAVKGGRLFPANSILIATSATIGEHALITVPHLANQRFTSLALKPEFIDRFDMKFVFYYCFVLGQWCRNNTSVSSFASVDMAGFKRFKFPIPPVELQQEIVRVLDAYTSLEAELEARLETELEMRRQQYAYFRSSLLTFPDEGGGRWLSMGEIVTNLDSHRRPITRADRRIGQYPYFGANGIQDYVEDYLFDGTFLLMGEDGSVVKRDGSPVLNWATGRIWVNNHAHVLAEKSGEVRLRFLFHYLQTVDISAYVTGGTQPKLNQGNMNRIRVRVPPLEEQDRIVAILDRFDALVNDLSTGLPAEIAARQQQYAYYRDRLLTFQEAA